MCVPSFCTKSASSTPATWAVVVVYADGPAALLAVAGTGPPPL